MNKQAETQIPITLQTFLDVAGVMFVALDKKGKVTLINQKGCDILGYNQQEIIGKNWFDHFLPKKGIKEVKSVFHQLMNKQIQHEYYQNPVITKHGQERMIMWHNVILKDESENIIGTLSSGEDITEQKQAEKALQYRTELERLITTTSTNLINLSPEKIDKGIHKALQTIGEFADVDRSYVFLFQKDGIKMDNTHEWCAKGIAPQISRLKNVLIDNYQWSLGKIRQSKTVHIPCVASLPPEAKAEKEEFQSANIQSLVMVPVIYSSRVIGFLGFDSVRAEKIWPEDIITLLRTVGEIFANALERKQAEETLRTSEERFSKAFHSSPINLAISTLENGRYIDVNDSFLHNTGYSRDEVIGHTSTELKLFENTEDRKKLIQTLKKQKKLHDAEIRLRTKSGEIHIGAFSAELVEMKGEPCLLTVVNDITDRKRAEKALHIQHELGVTLSSSDNLTEALNQILKAALQIEEIDAGCIYLYDGKTGELHLAVHKGLSANFISNFSHYTADDFRTQIVLIGKPIYQHSLNLPSPLKDPFQRENLRALAVIPVIYEGKAVAALNLGSHINDTISSTSRDALEAIATQIGGVITRLKAENALQKSEERYRIVSEMISDIAYSVLVKSDGSLASEWIAGAFTSITGFTQNELEAHGGYLNLIHPDDRSLVIQHMQVHLSNQSDIAEFRIINKKGEVHWLRNYRYPIWDKLQNRVVRIIGAAQDVTKRKKAEEQIQKDLKEKEILLKEIYHRVKNNLNVITSLLNLQANKIQTKEEALEAFKESRDRVFAMALIHEKLYMSEDFAQVDMKSYIKSMIQELAYIHKAGSYVKLDIQVKDVYLDINTAIPCGLILNELVTNIFKYAFPDKRKGILQILFNPNTRGKYELIVHDNGIGLPLNMDIEKVESLGLQLVQMLTKQIDGVLKTNRNDGTRFQITFPVKKS